MLKIINEKKKYQSRSKNTAKLFSTQKINADVRKSREDFQVDCNGYFIWKSEDSAKKL